MADRILKPDSGNDLVLQNDDASAKIEINEAGTIIHTGTSSIDVSGGTFTTSSAQKTAIVDGGKGNLTKSDIGLSNVTNDAQVPASGGSFTGNVSFSDNNITNVGDIAVDTISSDAGTSIGVTLGTDSGDDFNVGSGKFVVEGDTGNVGIGTASPSTPIEVVNTSFSSSVTGGKLRHGTTFQIQDSGSNLAQIVAYSEIDKAVQIGLQRNKTSGSYNDAWTIGMPEDSKDFRISKDTLGTALTIDSSGNVLIGTATAEAASVAVFAGNEKGIAIKHTGTGSFRRSIYGTSSGNLYFWNGSNEGYLSSAGAWTNASDARLKTNIRDIEYGLNTVLSSQPRHFERVDVDGTYIGFVAQELQEIVPEVVSGDPEKQLGVDYGSLVAIAFKAIKELKSENDDLKARITALENATN